MRLKSILLFGLIGVAILCALGFVFVGIVVPIVAEKAGPEDQLQYPIIWELSEKPSEASGNPSTIELDEDGTANLINVRIGEIHESEGDRPCVAIVESGFTGSATWEIDENGALRVHGDGGSAVFTPWAARFGGADWQELREYFCDQSFADFGTVSEPW